MELNKGGESCVPTLATLQRQKADLEAQIDENTSFLDEVAAHLCSCEEQQRIVGDILDLRDKLTRIDNAIAAQMR